jgi:predicted adenine nucleotide alpha hydrolase (AANH) superfamily ATPase
MNKKTLLIQTCCAPCVLPILEYLKDKDLDITLYYFNPNILDEEEF